MQHNIKQKQKKDDKAAVKEPSPSAKKMQDMILQEIKKTHKKKFRSTLIVFEIEKCKRDIRENDERRKEEDDDERRKEDVERRIVEKTQESIAMAEKKRLDSKHKREAIKNLKLKQKQENKQINAALIKATANVAAVVAVQKALVENLEKIRSNELNKEEERQLVLKKRRMKIQRRKQERKVDKNERYSKKTRRKNMKVKKIRQSKNGKKNLRKR